MSNERVLAWIDESRYGKSMDASCVVSKAATLLRADRISE